MKVLYLLPVASQARFHKRIRGLKYRNVEARALFFERDYYPGPPLPCPSESIGRIDHGRYLNRAWTYLGAMKRIRASGMDCDHIYAFGLDLAILTWLATLGSRHKPAIFLELGDIRPIMNGPSFLARAVRTLTRLMLRHCQAVVVTSEKYIEGYFKEFFPDYSGKFFVIENKLPESFSPPSHGREKSLDSESIRIGYFGLLRCSRSWTAIQNLLELGKGRFSVKLAGELWFPEVSKNEILAQDNLEYIGNYRYPDDLALLYRDVDLVWVAHFHGHNNLKWARANRFYESCYFGKPMIGQAGTIDGNYIEENNLGLMIDLAKPYQAAQSILALKSEKIKSWEQAVLAVPSSIYMLTNEHYHLAEFMQSIERPIPSKRRSS